MLADKALVTYDLDNERIIMRHGPIDMFVKIEADDENIQYDAVRALTAEFENLLPKLCEELPTLRTEVELIPFIPDTAVGKRMYDSAAKVADYDIVTPMICVAGSVADHICQFIESAFQTKRIIVNNGGDIAFRLTSNQTIDVGICDDIAQPKVSSVVSLDDNADVGGIATSGWKGRSFSLGIADAVTVLANSAADADACATVIANAVDLPNSNKVKREPANMISPDSDLGKRKVTVWVGNLSVTERDAALSDGIAKADELLAANLIHSAYLALQGSNRVVTNSKTASPNQIVEN